MNSENNMDNNKGVIFCCTGWNRYFSNKEVIERTGKGDMKNVGRQVSYLPYAIRSAKSIKKLCPHLPIVVYTDERNFDDSCFDEVRPLDGEERPHTFAARIKALADFPFKRNLHIDADTMVLSSRIEEVFEILDKFDFAAAHEPAGVSKNGTCQIENVPASFTEVNGGVILYSHNDKVEKLLRDWHSLYLRRDTLRPMYSDIEERGFQQTDQPSLRKLLWESSLQFYTLSPQFNWRAEKPISNSPNPYHNTVIHHNRFFYPDLTNAKY